MVEPSEFSLEEPLSPGLEAIYQQIHDNGMAESEIAATAATAVTDSTMEVPEVRRNQGLPLLAVDSDSDPAIDPVVAPPAAAPPAVAPCVAARPAVATAGARQPPQPVKHRRARAKFSKVDIKAYPSIFVLTDSEAEFRLVAGAHWRKATMDGRI